MVRKARVPLGAITAHKANVPERDLSAPAVGLRSR